jgi:hypothetical protein
LGVEVKRGGFQRLGEAGQAFLRLIRAHRFLPPSILLLLLRLEVSIPGVVGVPMDNCRLKYCIVRRSLKNKSTGSDAFLLVFTPSVKKTSLNENLKKFYPPPLSKLLISLTVFFLLHQCSSTHSLRPKRVAYPYFVADLHPPHHAGFGRRFHNVPDPLRIILFDICR